MKVRIVRGLMDVEIATAVDLFKANERPAPHLVKLYYGPKVPVGAYAATPFTRLVVQHDDGRYEVLMDTTLSMPRWLAA